jgi:hypothetical protein
VAAAGIIGKGGVRARGVVDHRHLPGIVASGVVGQMRNDASRT